MKLNSIDKYLKNYAEAESQEIDLVSDIYDYVIVIPICDESFDCLESIFSELENNLSVLLVMVVNSAVTGKILSNQENNRKYINHLIKKSNHDYPLSNQSRLLKFDHLFDTVLVDRNSDGLQIDKKQGVGLARKIGCDIALKYYQKGKIKNPWIFSTDADVVLPVNYFQQVDELKSDYSAIVLDFVHFSKDALMNKLQYYYDFKIRYYHAGIVYAGSRYDYIPLGSTLIANMQCYAQVRGFPKKNAGEDFYLLNKLAKIKPIAYKTNNISIKIYSRFSDRVPFGTGPALMQINALKTMDDYLYYHPRCFVLLKHWMDYLNSIWKENRLNIKPPIIAELLGLYHFLDCPNIFEKSKSQIKSKSRWSQFVHQWFDAFKTLKAVHYFDKILGKLNNKQLLKSADFAMVKNNSLQALIIQNDKS